ncbi:T9SS type A sorting domain-containing protein [uncultured Fibrella sp.]|uniref:Ig-like domain-containing protein n=1 Tax=uncultured Fibrella sp. TaxID=1284596 RepID=UPI0035CA7487
MQQASSIGVSLTVAAGASASMYTPEGNPAGGYYPTTRFGDVVTINFRYGDFQRSPTTPNFTIVERLFYATQTLDGCESDRAQTKVRTLYWPTGGPNPANQYTAQYGQIAYCQGETAVPLNVKGVETAIENYRIIYQLGDGFGSSFSPNPPTPPTNTPGRTMYALQYEAIDPTRSCTPIYSPSAPNVRTYLYVDVNARPAKPSLSTSTLTYCQNQTANLLAASATETGASILWYTTPTGSTATTTVPRPSTTQTGTFKYYTAQILNNCESDRAEITVEVKAASVVPTATNPTYCVGQQASPLSAIAASGGSLLWYTASSGGIGSQAAPTPTTNNATTQIFYVAQTVGNNCESQRVPVTVTVNPIPPAPILSSTNVAACQSTTANSLVATGQNITWYTEPSGGTGVSTLRPNTDAIGAKLYYASQKINSCEGPRSSVTVTVKGRPGVPKVDSVKTICQAIGGNLGGSVLPINVEISVGATASLYNADGAQANYFSRTESSFNFIYNSFGSSGTYKYPVNEITYYATQTVDGCESARIPTTIRTLFVPGVGPSPANQFDAFTGRITYCQGELAQPLNTNGHKPPIENYRVIYLGPEQGATYTPNAPTPSTSTPGRTSYRLRYDVIDGTKSCNVSGPRYAETETTIQVDVNPKPTKPTITNNTITYCQNQTADLLSATANTGANLVWYGVNATGGTSSATAPRPATDQAGTFRYYVAQSLNGCEGDRAEVLVTVKATLAQPSVVGQIAYCQNQPTSPLSATGTQLRWTLPTNQSVTDAPTPTAQTVGTVSYFVTQTVDGCESNRAEIKVTVKRTPDAPGTSARSICQNETAPVLTAEGQGLKWYPVSTGGEASNTAPLVNSGQAGQTIYYVSQSLDGCEGPRAPLTVTVKALPSAPGVTKVDLCQFAKASPLVAAGSGLTWYDTDGKSIGSTGPTPATDKGATFAYQVSQTADGCSGLKATLTVTIMTTPLPALTKTLLELCKGSSAAPLEATGTGLKWTGPTGVISTTAPVPFTTETTKNPDGDAYYVTQTGANGCESPRAMIRVFVQGPPTLALLGATTVNLGIEAPISLKFTGVGPYQYKISTGLSQSLTGSAVKDTTILVLPTRTTTYQVTEVNNRCGVGLPISTATVVVLVPTIQVQSLLSSTVCAGSILSAAFLTTGQFNPGSSFRVQLARPEADTSRIQYTDLQNTQVNGGQISASIPATATAGSYLVRVIATNPKIPILGTPSSTPLTIRPLPGATLATNTATIYEGEAVKLAIAFTGDGPWTFSYRDSSTVANTVKEILTNANPHIIDARPPKSTTYRITALTNGCGPSLSLPASLVVTVNPLLAVEPLAELIKVYPIPVLSTVNVQIDPSLMSKPATLLLVNEKGGSVLRQDTLQLSTQLNLSGQPAGVYILHIQVGQHLISRRLIKL